jgi:hypothetical protein
MYKDALTATEHSCSNDSRLVWCEATEDNISDLRRWASASALWFPPGAYGETHYHDRWEFRGWDLDCGGYPFDWCVAVEPPEEV